MLLKITLDDRFLWLKNYTPSARRKLIEHVLDTLTPEKIQQILSLPSPRSSEVKTEEKIESELSKIDASKFEI